MGLRSFLVISSLLAGSVSLAPAQAPGGAPSALLQISHKTDAPGTSLTPGSYSIRIADHLNDRLIIQVQKRGSGTPATFLAFPNPNLTGAAAGGPILFGSGLKDKPTLRGYAFSGGPTVEFVYPKKDAVTLAKANDVRVMAVDPASEGLPKLPELTRSDMNEVTLWMLTPTPVQPGDSKPGIQAARYQPPASSSAQGTTTADNSAPSSPAGSRSSYRTHAQSSQTAPVQVARNERPQIRPAVKQLPHTASNLPLVALGGCFAMIVGLGLTFRRRLAGAQG